MKMFTRSTNASTPANADDAHNYSRISTYAKTFMDEIIDESMDDYDPEELPIPQSIYTKQTIAVPDNMAPGPGYALEDSYATADELLVISHATDPAGETNPREAEEVVESSLQVLPPRITDLAPDLTADEDLI